ncbi:SOS response-associated peptidase [Lysobacter sp. S4-A87]|uniref:SOS response-associated peptidase family protein n=1 Tax=Lysobacter sp. S4-A87 TaxID=2925843 RepID=UPI001F52E186|nr:SOS response-associated peptidase family protein [Lysobacter sp. S4-A87]UNK50148.1 SOS response-associated peptidase [Lysobacter sp. S4-A87]
MCYSAQIWADYRKFAKVFGATISIQDFVRLYWERGRDGKARIPKAMDAAFAEPLTDLQHEIKALIVEFNRAQTGRYEQELFKQRKRLFDAERILLEKTTKKALEEKRIATDKIEWARGKLADLHRGALVAEDSRIFPGHFAPVMVWENGGRVIKPMRYQCRPQGKPANFDQRFPGTYNARRDNLQGFWKEQFGYTHGIVLVNAFYENVSRHAVEHRDLRPDEKEENVVLEFRPEPEQDMLVACLWSKWKGSHSAELLSFAAITDDPPAEIAAVGHDRCIIPIKRNNIDAWLNPDPNNLAAMYAILDDRERPYYEHRLAA